MPQLHSLVQRIEVAAAVQGLLGEDWIAQRLEAGESTREIMADFGHTRTMFYHWLRYGADGRRLTDDELATRKKKIEDARRDSAPALLDKAGDVLDERVGQVNMPSDVQLAKARSDHAVQLAGIRNPAFNPRGSAAVQVNLNIGDLHLDALRAAGAPVQIAATVEEPKELMPAEVVEE